METTDVDQLNTVEAFKDFCRIIDPDQRERLTRWLKTDPDAVNQLIKALEQGVYDLTAKLKEVTQVMTIAREDFEKLGSAVESLKEKKSGHEAFYTAIVERSDRRRRRRMSS